MTDYSHYQYLAFKRAGRVLVLSLNRPASNNAVNADLHRELSEVFYDIARDAETDVVVLTGEGRNFCTGGDIKWFADISESEIDQLFNEARTIIVSLLEMEKPVVTAINGMAIGFGCTLALFGDIIYMAENAIIADPHVSGAGVAAGDGSAVIWPWLTGMARAKEFLFTGDKISAQQAQQTGLVNHVVEPEQLMSESLAFAQRLAALPQRALRGTKASLNQILRDTVNQVLDSSLAREKECFGTADNKEAIQAFIQKRPPVFSGK